MDRSPRLSMRELLLTALLVIPMAPVVAHDDQAAQQYAAGVQAFAQHDYARARDSFTTSYGLLRHPQTAYFLSYAYMELLDKPQANSWAQVALSPMPPFTLAATYADGAREIIHWATYVPPPPPPSEGGIGISTSAITGPPPSPAVPGALNLGGGTPAAMITAAVAVNVDPTAKRCRVYSSIAVGEQQINQKYQCGFTGARWNPNYSDHEQWCVNQASGVSQSETTVRQGLLEACSADIKTRCSVYAAMAVDQQNMNEAARCRYTGNRWTTNVGVHYQWCITVPPEAANSETTTRRTMLDSCAP